MTDAEAAADAFDALSDPTRVAILRELVSRFYATEGRPVRFAELRRAVGVDDPGRFNYHLDTLRGRFVDGHDDGYTPTVAGLKAMQSAETGVYTETTEPTTETIDYECPDCGEPLVGTFENNWITVTCDDHGTVFRTLVHSSVGVEEGVDTVVEYAVGEMWRRVDRLADGLCPVCRTPAVSLSFAEADDTIVAESSCDECYFVETNAVVLFALTHPAVSSLLRNGGFDVPQQLPFESFDDWIDGVEFTDDGRAVEISLAVDGERVTVRVDEDLAVTIV